MKNKETNKENYEFTVHPCNFKVHIKEIKPYYVYSRNYIFLDLQVLDCCSAKSRLRIKSCPHNGKLYYVEPSILVYKPTNGFCGYDLIQVLIEDEFDGRHIENIIIRVIS
ncbi:hypothetical protein D2A34_12280 [Clostridium chromiireducens]|uniref:Uncharacterized protein n=1 Tax=Clostridium chromiireducens TaxID=225345 RepID=A0A399INT3_9CLOT|nr:hypothetical protein [Clostridium chromiireducens]RII33959.1 hypothetical protein D2A34_12280 [Clostridium chromiireducens]